MPDARVQAAIDHWAPRFVQAGVDYNDFLPTTARVESWEEWLGAWCDTASEHVGSRARPRSAAPAQRRRGLGARGGVLPLRQVRLGARRRQKPGRRRPRRSRRSRRRTSCSTPGWSGSRCRWTAGASSRTCAGRSGEERPPLVVLIPGLDSTKEEFFRLENVFLERGMATASLDGPGQGEGGYDLPIRPDYEVAVGRAARRARGPRGPRPRPHRRAGRQPGRLLRAARRRLRAAAEGGGRHQRPVQLRRVLGRACRR